MASSLSKTILLCLLFLVLGMSASKYWFAYHPEQLYGVDDKEAIFDAVYMQKNLTYACDNTKVNSEAFRKAKIFGYVLATYRYRDNCETDLDRNGTFYIVYNGEENIKRFCGEAKG